MCLLGLPHPRAHHKCQCKSFAALYLCLLLRPLRLHLLESLQHPAKVCDTEVETDSFIVLPWSTEKQLPEFRINFTLFFWRELFFSGRDHPIKAEKIKACQGFACFFFHRKKTTFFSLTACSRFLEHGSEILSPLFICQKKERRGKRFVVNDLDEAFFQYCCDVKQIFLGRQNECGHNM